MYSLFAIVFVNFIGIGALIPVLPFTVVDHLGYSETVMTALLASFALAMFIANPILGQLSDRFGRKPILVIALAVNMAAHLWFAMSEDITQLFLARILAGFAAGNIGVIQAIITDSTSSEKRAKIMGMLGASIGAGFVLGPALGGGAKCFWKWACSSNPLFSGCLFRRFCLCASYPAERDTSPGQCAEKSWKNHSISFACTARGFAICSGIFLFEFIFCTG